MAYIIGVYNSLFLFYLFIVLNGLHTRHVQQFIFILFIYCFKWLTK